MHLTTSFLDVVHKYGDKLEILGFDLPTLTSDEFLSILRQSSVLKQISIGLRIEQRYSTPPDYPFDNATEFFSLRDSHLVALTPTQGGNFLCPRLEIFRCDSKATASLETLLRFLRARVDPGLLPSGGGSKLRELSLTRLPLDSGIPTFRPWTKDEDDPLTEIREAGVLLELSRPVIYNPSDNLSFFPNSKVTYETDFKQ
ncbi:hypothetical protein NMY22_g18344 [Coprinellus aureogranulatus]|nr:hypothetical protein NMY22_g18344 [Coprinellus aureogranulatus]